MANLLNPLDWLQSTQDWFARSERSSGFRPLLIAVLICFGMAVVLLTSVLLIPFPESEFFRTLSYVLLILAAGLIAIPLIVFLILFCVKAFQDPDFCRSEVHVQNMKRIELEKFGSEEKVIDADDLEQQLLHNAKKETRALEDKGDTEVPS